MTDATQGGAEAAPKPTPLSFVALFSNRIVKTVAIIAALFTIYTEGATAYVNTEEAIKAKAGADNAALRQKAEAEAAEQQARTQLEAARNSAERLKGEADKAEAEAKKAEFDAQTAEQTAHNAELKTRSEAVSLTYEAEIRRSKAISELEAARVAARKFKAQADSTEQETKITDHRLKHTRSAIWECHAVRAKRRSRKFKLKIKAAADDRATTDALARPARRASQKQMATTFCGVARLP